MAISAAATRVLDEEVHPARLFCSMNSSGSKSFTSPAKCVARSLGVEAGDGRDARLAREQALPVLLGPGAERRDRARVSGDDDAASSTADRLRPGPALEAQATSCGC